MRMWSLPRAIVSIVDTIRFQALSGVTPSPKLSLCALSGLRSEFSHCGLAREWRRCDAVKTVAVPEDVSCMALPG